MRALRFEPALIGISDEATPVISDIGATVRDRTVRIWIAWGEWIRTFFGCVSVAWGCRESNLAGYPHTLPRSGEALHRKNRLHWSQSWQLSLPWFTPDFGRFYVSHGGSSFEMEAVLGKNLPRRSRDGSRDRTGSHTDGLFNV